MKLNYTYTLTNILEKYLNEDNVKTENNYYELPTANVERSFISQMISLSIAIGYYFGEIKDKTVIYYDFVTSKFCCNFKCKFTKIVQRTPICPFYLDLLNIYILTYSLTHTLSDIFLERFESKLQTSFFSMPKYFSM